MNYKILIYMWLAGINLCLSAESLDIFVTSSSQGTVPIYADEQMTVYVEQINTKIAQDVQERWGKDCDFSTPYQVVFPDCCLVKIPVEQDIGMFLYLTKSSAPLFLPDYCELGQVIKIYSSPKALYICEINSPTGAAWAFLGEDQYNNFVLLEQIPIDGTSKITRAAIEKNDIYIECSSPKQLILAEKLQSYADIKFHIVDKIPPVKQNQFLWFVAFAELPFLPEKDIEQLSAMKHHIAYDMSTALTSTQGTVYIVVYWLEKVGPVYYVVWQNDTKTWESIDTGGEITSIQTTYSFSEGSVNSPYIMFRVRDNAITFFSLDTDKGELSLDSIKAIQQLGVEVSLGTLPGVKICP